MIILIFLISMLPTVGMFYFWFLGIFASIYFLKVDNFHNKKLQNFNFLKTVFAKYSSTFLEQISIIFNFPLYI